MRYALIPLLALAIMGIAGCPEGTTVPGDTTGDGGGDEGTSEIRVLPESIALEVDELSDSSQSSSAPPGPTPSTLGSGAAPLAIAKGEAERTMAQLDEIMVRFGIINSMVTSAADVQISGSIVWDTYVPGSTPSAGGSRVANPGSGAGVTRQIKVDFSAFDYDGDGTNDGTGTPTVAPVALRVWVTDGSGTYQPAACGLIDVLPTASHPGTGEMITLSYARNGDGDIAILQWDQDDPNEQSLWTWDEHPNGPGAWGYSSFMVTHEMVSLMVQKSVASTIDNEYVAATWYEGAPAAAVISHVGTWADYLATPPTVQYSDFATFGSATATDALSVDTTDLDCIEQPDPSDFNWPSSFPATPTF